MEGTGRCEPLMTVGGMEEHWCRREREQARAMWRFRSERKLDVHPAEGRSIEGLCEQGGKSTNPALWCRSGSLVSVSSWA